MKEINDKYFKNFIEESDKPVLVDFWAPWCSPCRALLPIMESLSEELADTITIVKMNVDDNSNTPQQFGIRSIPTLMIFKAGQLVDQSSGARTKEALIDWIKSVV